ncbi:MAG: copper resistance protein NlpE [Prevotellaceae bacterium]|jgi:uncharacterized lipoprotein NlpE involved in copper resistance|nr:copper resistance protein NlpE [Prevotellaceae bacterium]
MNRFVLALSIISIFTGSGLNSCKSKPRTAAKPSNEIVAVTADNSRTSLNWDGVYSGVIPCASCPGINVKITLKTDETYELVFSYLERGKQKYTHKGKFKWSKDGSKITLDIKEGEFSTHYKVGENVLIVLDSNGDVITGELAGKYRLAKES